MDSSQHTLKNSAVSNPVTLAQLEQAQPYKPTCQSEDFLKAKLLTDELLERAGAVGMTVPELRAKGCGERPPNRICDLRKDGQAIVTRREANRVTRYIKAKFLSRPAAPISSFSAGKREPAWEDRRRITGLALWDAAVSQ